MFNNKKTPQERLEEIQEKSQTIIQRAIQVNTKIEAANENKRKLNETLMSKYKTNSIQEMESMLAHGKRKMRES